MTSLHDFQATTIDGTLCSLEQFRNQVVLIVNVASKCGFTPQYAGLEALYQTYRDQGFTILGFPCNQFGFQEPASNDEIKAFCQLQYNVSFPIFAKTDVNGQNAHPLYQWLKTAKPGWLGTEAVKWNFTKFLIGRDGQVIERFAPTDTPEKLKEHIARLCNTPAA